MPSSWDRCGIVRDQSATREETDVHAIAPAPGTRPDPDEVGEYLARRRARQTLTTPDSNRF